MDKEKIIASVLDKLRQNTRYLDLYEDLLEEKNPLELENKFRRFLTINEITDKQDLQNLFAFLKLEGLFKEHVKTKELHDAWLKMKNEYAPRFLLEN